MWVAPALQTQSIRKTHTHTQTQSCHLAASVLRTFPFYELYAALMKYLIGENVGK